MSKTTKTLKMDRATAEEMARLLQAQIDSADSHIRANKREINRLAAQQGAWKRYRAPIARLLQEVKNQLTPKVKRGES